MVGTIDIGKEAWRLL